MRSLSNRPHASVSGDGVRDVDPHGLIADMPGGEVAEASGYALNSVCGKLTIV